MATKKNPDAKAAKAAADQPDDGDATELSALDDVETLPRVGRVAVETRVKRIDPPKEVDAPKANIAWRLKPFAPKTKKQMVTMSDIGMGGTARGGSEAARRKRPS